MFQVDEGHDDKNRRKEKCKDEMKREAVVPEKKDGHYRRDQLDRNVTGGYLLPAIPAPPPQEKIAQNRDIIIGPDGVTAAWTRRGRKYQGFFFWNSVNTNVQEAPDNGSKYGYEDIQQEIHGPS